MTSPIPWRRLAVCATAIALCSSAFAADYPSRPIKVVVPFGPGGAAQALAERVGAEISRTLGQPLVHEYKGGAAGLVGAETAARAPADGYTVFMGVPSALIVAPLVMKSLTRFDPEGDFQPIAGIAVTPFVVLVNAKLPIGNLRELIDYGRQHPGKLNFGSIGSNGTDYIAGQVLQREAGFQMTSVPYKSVGTLLPDILSGRVDVAILSPIPIMAHVGTGDLRLLAVTSGKRSESPALKDVPTVAEQGVPGYEIVSWYGYFAPRGTSPDQIRSINRAAAAALGDAGVSAYLKEQGLQPFGLSPEQFTDYYRADMKKWAQFVRDANIPVQ